MLVIVREIGDRQGEVNGLANLGAAYKRFGEIQKAASLLRQTKTIGEQIGDSQIVEAVTRRAALNAANRMVG